MGIAGSSKKTRTTSTARCVNIHDFDYDVIHPSLVPAALATLLVIFPIFLGSVLFLLRVEQLH